MILTGDKDKKNKNEINKLRDMKNRGQLQKIELFPELKWYHKLWNRIVVGVVVWLK